MLIQAIPPDPARRTPEGTEARLRFTGGQTAEGLPVGFQIVGRHMEEALLLRSTCVSAGDGMAHERPSVEQ